MNIREFFKTILIVILGFCLILLEGINVFLLSSRKIINRDYLYGSFKRFDVIEFIHEDEVEDEIVDYFLSFDENISDDIIRKLIQTDGFNVIVRSIYDSYLSSVFENKEFISSSDLNNLLDDNISSMVDDSNVNNQLIIEGVLRLVFKSKSEDVVSSLNNSINEIKAFVDALDKVFASSILVCFAIALLFISLLIVLVCRSIYVGLKYIGVSSICSSAIILAFSLIIKESVVVISYDVIRDVLYTFFGYIFKYGVYLFVISIIIYMISYFTIKRRKVL